MATALLEFVQGPNSGLAGEAVEGTLTDGAVTASNGDDTGVISWKFEILYVPPGSAVGLSTQGPGPTTTFMFTPDVAGSYRIRLTVTDASGASDVDIRNFCVPFPNGIIAPPYQRNPTPLALTGAAGKPDEMNIDGQPFGWDGVASPAAKLLFQALQILDGLAGGGEANTSSNAGGSEGLALAKVGVDLPFKGLTAGLGITLTSDSTEVIITNSGVRTLSNLGAGSQVFKLLTAGKDAEFRTLIGGTNITLVVGADTITIDAAGAAGESNTASSAGGTESLVLTKVGVDLPFKGLTAGAGVTLTPGANDITIAATGTGEANTASSSGGTESLVLTKVGVDLPFKGLTAGANITLTPSGTDVTIAATTAGETNTASNVGGGSEVFKIKTGVDFVFRTLIGGANVTVTQNTDDITITLTGVELTANKGIASGYASLDASIIVVEPSNKLRETSGPTTIPIGAWGDETHLVRDGANAVGYSTRESTDWLVFAFDTGTTDANPGTGNFRLNNVTQGSATQIFVNDANRVSVDVSSTLLAIKSGARCWIGNSRFKSTTEFRYFEVTADAIDATTYVKIPVTAPGAVGNDFNSGTFCIIEVLQSPPAAGTGEANTASSSGGTESLVLTKVGVDLPFKGLTAGTGVTLTPGASDVTIASTGEANTSSSSGGTESLVLAKSGVDLPFKGLTAGTGVTLTPSGTDVTIAADVGIAEIQVGLDSAASAVAIGGTPTTVPMGFSAVTFDAAVYTFTPNDTDVVVDVTGRYQIILDGSVMSTAAGVSNVLVEIFNTGVPITNAQTSISVDNATVADNGFMVNRFIDLSASDSVGPRFTQTSGAGSASVAPGSMRFSLVFHQGSIAGAVARKSEIGLVVTAPHAIDTDSGTPFKIEGSGEVRELIAVAQVDTDVAGGSFTFDVQHGPDAGPFVSIGSVTITQGNRSGSFVPGAPVAFAAEDVFVIDRTAIGAFPGGTAEDKQRITVQLRVDID